MRTVLQTLHGVWQAGDALAKLSPEAAQAKGQVLLNLRCTGSEGGLLGRTLITLVSNKVHAVAAQGFPQSLLVSLCVLDLRLQARPCTLWRNMLNSRGIAHCPAPL